MKKMKNWIEKNIVAIIIVIVFIPIFVLQCHSVNRLLIKTVYHNLPIIENTVQLVTP